MYPISLPAQLHHGQLLPVNGGMAPVQSLAAATPVPFGCFIAWIKG